MHRRAREHVGLVIKRKIMRRQRKIINGIKGGWRKFKMVQLFRNECLERRTFRSQWYKGGK